MRTSFCNAEGFYRRKIVLSVLRGSNNGSVNNYGTVEGRILTIVAILTSEILKITW